MATIGLDKLYYAKITEDAEGLETYSTPQILAKAMTADLSVEMAEATLYADDGAAEMVKEFKSGTLSLAIDDIGAAIASDLTGCTIDKSGVVISTAEDGGAPVAIGFRARKANGKYRYYWLYRVKFSIPGTSLATKGDSITFSTPTIEGTIFRRNKADTTGKHPWKAEVTEGEGTVAATIITNWYKQVYEPNYGTSGSGTGGSN
jgi:phi13 family phage major tail protein